MRTDDRTVLDDDALVAHALAGDRAAFGELVRRHQPAALRVAAIVSGSTDDARDIAQDAFVLAHRQLATFRRRGTFRSWVLRVVANQAKNHVRSRVRAIGRDDLHARISVRAAAGDDPAELVEATASRQELADALSRLRHDDRAVLGCRFIAQLSEAETAAVLDLPVGTVKSRTSRALERLRAELDDEEDVR